MAKKVPERRLDITAKTLAKQELFAAAYVANGSNGAAAAIAAQFSAKTAATAAVRLLKKPAVQARIAVLRKELLDKHAFKADDVMRQLAAIVRFDPRKLYREDGTLKEVHELDDDTASALAGIEVTVETTRGGQRRKKRGESDDNDDIEYTKKLKWFDKNVAVANAMKHFKLIGDDKGTTVNVGIVVMPSEFQKFL